MKMNFMILRKKKLRGKVLPHNYIMLLIEKEFLLENQDKLNAIEDNILTSLSRISLQRESQPIIFQ